MYKLTAMREEKATDILSKHRQAMAEHGRIITHQFEQELRECWNIGYQELKDIVIELFKRPEYQRMAAYYMQHQNTPGPVSEFKPHLAKLYGVEYYDSPETKAKRKAYWSE